MVVFTLSVLDRDDRERFFEESFLLADIKPVIVLRIPFLTMNNVDIDFQARNLQCRSYTTKDILLTIRRVELIWKKKFAIVVLDLKHEAFVIHVAVLSIDLGDEVHPSKRAQIAYFKADKAPIKVLSKYVDFAKVFS